MCVVVVVCAWGGGRGLITTNRTTLNDESKHLQGKKRKKKKKADSSHKLIFDLKAELLNSLHVCLLIRLILWQTPIIFLLDFKYTVKLYYVNSKDFFQMALSEIAQKQLTM